MNLQDTWDACDAFQEWCKSQGLQPHEAVQVAEMFIAKMIAYNATSDDNLEAKFDLVNEAIRDSVALCLVQGLGS